MIFLFNYSATLSPQSTFHLSCTRNNCIVPIALTCHSFADALCRWNVCVRQKKKKKRTERAKQKIQTHSSVHVEDPQTTRLSWRIHLNSFLVSNSYTSSSDAHDQQNPVVFYFMKSCVFLHKHTLTLRCLCRTAGERTDKHESEYNEQKVWEVKEERNISYSC